MTTFTIDVEIRIGKENASVFNTWIPPVHTNDIELDRYGSLWGENEVLFLGAHYDIYSSSSFTSLGNRIGATTHSVPTSYTISNAKSPGGSVSGNFGEVLTILALESKITPRPLRVCHLSSVLSGAGAIKCPDLILESSPLSSDYLAFRTTNPTAPTFLPDIIPGECKNNAYLKALRQLAQYWIEISSASPIFGFGLISSINYRTNQVIKFNLLVPEDKPALISLLGSKPVDELKQRDFRGILYGF
ncbi:hypothetical protein [Rossellomorea vietnamensis]|uniref:Uncharacterized protein n=1 Tax=Rossellomorea vietnamensis TaxID=218284 RepID=A0A0P6WIQ7_9BACI|nr:hypothetical protein [Rossellomorea vietnamensis]KPL57647.1 hypothetical protein AM506_21020 [Rossellomorea vietnamensis]